MNTRQHQHQRSHQPYSKNQFPATSMPVQTELKLEHTKVLAWTAAGLTVVIAFAGFEAGIWCFLSRSENQLIQPKPYSCSCHYVSLPDGQKQCQ